MSGYYKERLSALRLKQVYDIAPERVRRYLAAEIEHVLRKIEAGDLVLELGCGYGRVLALLCKKAGLAIGIDNSIASLQLAKGFVGSRPNCRLVLADALQPGFRAAAFDVVVCIQNGISAFHVDQRELVRQAIRITRPGGTVLFSSYSQKFWQHRLEWFYLQSEAGLLGKIDEEKTRNGVIVCKDGFSAGTVDKDGFCSLMAGLAVAYRLSEVDDSSLFCEIYPNSPPGFQ